jgi:transposase
MLVIGIDIGKEELVACLQQSHSGEPAQTVGSLHHVANTLSGHHKLKRWLEKLLRQPGIPQGVALAEVHVVMEATNVYWQSSAYYFHAQGCRVSVVNPAQIKFFARSTLRRGKTDAMDAELIARFGLMMRPGLWNPPPQALVEIKQLVREREAVLQQLTRERNHGKALQQAQHAAPLALRLIRQRVRLLERQVQVIETAIRDAFSQDQALQAKLDLLLSVPGFGFVAAVTVLAETSAFETLDDGHQLGAYAGLAPAPNQSGLANRRGCISKVGNARLRRIAYLAALGARNSNSRFRAFYNSLRERGKPPRLALVAVARKLLRVGLAVVKSGQPYQATYQRASQTSCLT